MDTKDWAKLIAAWIATLGGWLTEHITLGKVALLATLALTLLQCYKVWLDIRVKRRFLRIQGD